MLRILVILFIHCSISSVYSQTKLNGKLVDAFSGEPIEAAKVKIKGLNKGGMTDKDGLFFIEIELVFPITLVSSYLGYEDQETTLYFYPQDSIIIRLKPSSIKNFATINIRSFASEKEKESALSVETMTLSEIKATPALDFYDGLSHMKGVDLTSASIGFKVVNTRGFNSTSPVRTLQIIDGVDNASPGLNFALGNF